MIFWLLGRGQPSTAVEMFGSFGFDKGLAYALPVVLSTVVLAPVCEEILYRGIMLRAIHDGLRRRWAGWVAPVIAIAVSSIAFALPHVQELNATTLAYLITGVAFGLVYVVTGSLTAAMLSHSLQSCFAFAQILWFGRGDTVVSPVLWIVVLACPILVVLVARGLYAVLPKAAPSGR